MREAAKKFEFEKAAQLRDRIRSLKQKTLPDCFLSNHPRCLRKKTPNCCRALDLQGIKRVTPDDPALLDGDKADRNSM